MRHYPFSVGVGEAQRIQAAASYVRYYAVSAGAAAPTIELKNEIGSAVLLKPGQSLTLGRGKRAQDWIIGNYDGGGTITGVLVLGDGAIDDDRITGSVSIDSVASITGTVTTAGTVITQEQGFAYGASYVSNALLAAAGSSQVFAPAANTNGAVLHTATGYSGSAAAPFLVLVAKAGAAPANPQDGDIINVAVQNAAGSVTLAPLTGPVKVSAGKGVWFYSHALETNGHRSALYTLL